jgi:hypothetical protein
MCPVSISYSILYLFSKDREEHFIIFLHDEKVKHRTGQEKYEGNETKKEASAAHRPASGQHILEARSGLCECLC